MIDKFDTTQLIKSILADGFAMSPKSPNSITFKNSLNRSIKNRKTSNTGNVLNMTGYLKHGNKRGHIKLYKHRDKSKEKLRYNFDMSNYSRK